MRLYGGKVGPIATDVVRALIANKDIETESAKDVEADVRAVLDQYLALEREVNDRARDIVDRTGKPPSELFRVRQLVADEKGIKLGEDSLDYLLDQVVAIFQHSHHVEEIWVEDVDLRKRMAPIFKKYMSADDDLEGDIRAQIRHVREGTPQWDIEYARARDLVKRKRGL